MSPLSRSLTLSLGCTIVLGSLACAQGGGTAPDLAPSGAALPTTLGELNAPATEAGLALGMARLTIDPATATASLSQFRQNTAIGDAFLVGLNDLHGLIDVTNVRRDPVNRQRIVVTLDFRHPYPAATRPDLTGWDLKAILASDLNATHFAGPNVTLPVGLLDNPDGYTTEWTPEILAVHQSFQSTAFPYIILGVDETEALPYDFQTPRGFNHFAPGGRNQGELAFNLPLESTYDIDLFFTVGYQVSATKATRLTPDYQPPRGNMRAPWRIQTSIENNTLSTVPGSTATLVATAMDWQTGLGLGSDVAAITFYAPELTAAPLAPPLTFRDPPGRGMNGTTVITNDLGTLQNDFTLVLVEAQDALHQANPGGRVGQPGVDVVEDDFTTIRALSDFRTFQVLRVPIVTTLPGSDPTACATSEPPLVGGALTVRTGTLVQWDASCSTDPDPVGTPEGTICDWAWDTEWDGDPAHFVDENNGSGMKLQDHTYATAGNFHLGLRVKDTVGRMSPILDIPVTVTDRIFSLTLGDIQDIPLPAWAVHDQRETSACFTQLADNRIELNYAIDEYDAPGHVAYQLTSYWQPTTSDWTVSSGDLSSAGILGVTEYGFWMKTATNWGPDGEGIVLWGFSDAMTHEPRQTLYAHNCFLGTLAIIADINAEAAVGLGHGYEIATNPLSGDVLIFLTPLTSSSALQVQNGGSGKVGTQLTDWRTTYPAITIDSRPSRISYVRSTGTGPGGEMHLAYLSDEKDTIRYARDTAGDGQAWDLQDVQGGTWDSPALAVDDTGNVFIAAADFSDGPGFIYLYSSLDGGGSWDSGQPVGGATGGLQELSLSAWTILGEPVLALTYHTGSDIDASGETRLKWSINDGASWTDVLLSAGADTHYPDSLLPRDTPEFFVAWSADDPGMLPKLQARQGTWSYE